MNDNLLTWDSLVKKGLYETVFIQGSALLSNHRGQCIHSTGILLDEINEINSKQFLGLFEITSDVFTSSLHLNGFKLLNHHFTVYFKNNCSIYAITKRRRFGLIINNLPFGILLTMLENNTL